MCANTKKTHKSLLFSLSSHSWTSLFHLSSRFSLHVPVSFSCSSSTSSPCESSLVIFLVHLSLHFDFSVCLTVFFHLEFGHHVHDPGAARGTPLTLVEHDNFLHSILQRDALLHPASNVLLWTRMSTRACATMATLTRAFVFARARVEWCTIFSQKALPVTLVRPCSPAPQGSESVCRQDTLL